MAEAVVDPPVADPPSVADPAPAAAPVLAATAPAAAPAPAPAPAPAEPAQGYWPADWLSKVTKGDKKLEKSLGRYQSPEAVADAYVNLRKRLDSGEFKPVLPKDPKPEEIAQWRKDNGIPDKPDGYKLDGLTIPDQDRDIVNGILEKAHANNFTPEQAKAGVSLYYDIEKRNVDARLAKDEEQRVATLDTLNQEWGGTFRRNVNLVEGLLSKFPETVRTAMKSARLPDGTAAFNSPDILRGFAALALELNPAGVVVPNSGGDVNKVALEEYKDLQKFIREKRADYNKDDAKQDRMRQLIDHLTKEGLIDANGNERKAA